MLKIENLIELKTNRKTEKLSFATRYLDQKKFTFDLGVLLDSLGGTSHFCVNREQIEKLCADLTEMKNSFAGNTKLEDKDSDASVRFQIEQNGQVYVFGQVGGSHEANYVKFKFQTDQTCLEPLIEDFYKLLKYEEPTNLYETIDYILWSEWDPIGINKIAPRDEYRSYTQTIYNLKSKGADNELRVCFEKEKKRIMIMKKESICRNLWCQIINYKRWKK